MCIAWSRLLPSTPNATPGHDGPSRVLVAVAAISTVRSFIHMLAPDGGAQSIAGVRTDVAGGGNIVAVFAQWGASERYRALIPLIWLAIFGEPPLRLAGHLKPLNADEPPPGAYWTYFLRVLAFGTLLCSLWDSGGQADVATTRRAGDVAI